MKSILILDDDLGCRDCLGEAVHRYGYRPVPYADGASALSCLASREPVDAAIIDVIMPGMNGFEFLAHARRLAPSLPCIVLSGDGSIEQYLKVMQLGAVEYLNKPFRIKELGKILASVMNSTVGSAQGEMPFLRDEAVRGIGKTAGIASRE